MLTAEYGLVIGRDAGVGTADPDSGGAPGAGVAAAVKAGDCDAVLDTAAPDVGTLGGSGGGVKMPMRCLASRSFSSLAALAAALSCCRLILSSSRSLSRSRSISSVMPKLSLILADDSATLMSLPSSKDSSLDLSDLSSSIWASTSSLSSL